MEKQLQEALVEALSTVMEAKDFVLSELPDVVHQLLMWKAVESIIYNVMAIALVFVSIKLYKMASKGFEGNDSVENEIKAAGCIAIGALLNLISLIAFNIKFIQIWIAPKVYIIEYLKTLSK